MDRRIYSTFLADHSKQLKLNLNMFLQHFILCVFNHFLYLKSPIHLRCISLDCEGNTKVSWENLSTHRNSMQTPHSLQLSRIFKPSSLLLWGSAVLTMPSKIHKCILLEMKGYVTVSFQIASWKGLKGV